MTTLTNIQNIIAASNAITFPQLAADGQKVITDVVAAAEAIGGTGETKLSTAVAQAETDLVALGKDVGLELIHLAIETAVAQLSLTQPVVEAPAPTDAPAVDASTQAVS